LAQTRIAISAIAPASLYFGAFRVPRTANFEADTVPVFSAHETIFCPFRGRAELGCHRGARTIARRYGFMTKNILMFVSQ
jgi:hypothetical protein